MNQPPSSYAALQQFPLASSPTGYQQPPPQQQSHQQQQFFNNPNNAANPTNPANPSPYPQPQIHHPGQQHGFGPVPAHASAPGGAMMMSPGLPHHAAHPAQFTTNAPYAQSIVPTSVGQQQPSFAPHMGTPQTMASASGPGMTAPAQAFSTPPRTQQQQQQQPTISPQAAAREKARVTVLLDINSALLQEVINLQAAGKAGVPSNQPTSQSQQSSPTQESTASPTTTDFQGPSSSSQAAQQQQQSDSSAAAKGQNKQQQSQEYIDCMRRLQANLAYLATVADRGKKSSGAALQSPAIMTPPANVPAVAEMYAKLNELFKGQQQQQQQPMTPQRAGMQGQPSPQGNVSLEASG